MVHVIRCGLGVVIGNRTYTNTQHFEHYRGVAERTSVAEMLESGIGREFSRFTFLVPPRPAALDTATRAGYQLMLTVTERPSTSITDYSPAQVCNLVMKRAGRQNPGQFSATNEDLPPR
jgi:hypothetical protein